MAERAGAYGENQYSLGLKVAQLVALEVLALEGPTQIQLAVH